MASELLLVTAPDIYQMPEQKLLDFLYSKLEEKEALAEQEGRKDYIYCLFVDFHYQKVNYILSPRKFRSHPAWENFKFNVFIDLGLLSKIQKEFEEGSDSVNPDVSKLASLLPVLDILLNLSKTENINTDEEIQEEIRAVAQEEVTEALTENELVDPFAELEDEENEI